MIFNEGGRLDKLFLIQEGFVKLYRLSEEGRETTSYLLGPGYLLGVRALIAQDESARHNAEAITDLTVLAISRREYHENIIAHPDLLVDLLQVFVERLKYTERKLEGFIYADTTARVAIFLSDCASRFGIKKRKQIILPLPLTHQRISEFVGSFRETVTLALHRLEKDKAIRMKRGFVIITDLKKLNTHALIPQKP